MSVEVAAALRAKGTELALERDALLRKAEALAADITALDRAITILDPMQANAVASGRKRQKGASSLDGIYGRGEFQRDALEAIRTATGSISAHGIPRDMTVRKGLVLDDYPTRRGFEKRLSALLRSHIYADQHAKARQGGQRPIAGVVTEQHRTQRPAG